MCLVPIVAFATAELSPRAHTALSAILVAVALVVATGWSNVRLVVAMLSIAVSARYIWYRATHTLLIDASVDGAAALALFLAELYAFVVLILGYFQTAIVRRRVPAPIHLPDDELPPVDVFVPSYNEDTDLLRDTLVGCMAMDWPNKKVYLLDDGRRPEAKALATELGCEYLTRADNRGAKAGNVNAALKRTAGTYIAFFDADHIPVRSFLRSTMGFLINDPKVALVQTPHYFYNPDQFERNLHTEGSVPSEQKLFYHAIQPGNDFWNSSFFCGSCAVIRRDAMVGVGGMAEETLTEDAHTALKMHAAGWSSVYLDMPLAAGIATERLVFYVSQRIRWARGMAQVFRLDNPLLKRGLSPAQRLNYFAASWHFLFGLPRMVFVLAPILYLVFGFHPVFADVREVLVFALPHLLLAWIGQTVVNGNFRHSFWPEVFETIMAPYAALVTTLALMAPRGGSFKVTTKGATNDRTWFDWRRALPALVLLACTAAGIVGTFIRLDSTPLDRSTILVAGAWNLYNFAILAAASATALERPQRRTRHRVRRCWRAVATYVAPDAGVPLEWLGETTDLSPGGARVRFPGQPRLAGDIELRLEASWGLSSWMKATVLAQHAEGTDTVARVRFQGLSDAQRNDLVLFLFSDPTSWLEDRFMPDSPGRSILAVFVTPLAVLFNRGSLIRAAVGNRTSEPIVAPRQVPTCRSCGEALDPRETLCPACGDPVPAPPRPRRDRKSTRLNSSHSSVSRMPSSA